MDDRAEEEEDTPPVVIGTPLLANKQEGKVNFRKNRVKFFDEIISI
jgi:hypothetical protein